MASREHVRVVPVAGLTPEPMRMPHASPNLSVLFGLNEEVDGHEPQN